MRVCLFLCLLQAVFISTRPTSRKHLVKRVAPSRILSRDELTSLEGGVSIPLDFLPDVAGVAANIGIGSPPQNFKLIVDSGSGYTIIGSNNHKFIGTNTTRLTGRIFSAGFGQGNALGLDATEDVTLAPGLALTNQSIGLISAASDEFFGFDGILAIGPTAVSGVPFNDNTTVPNVMDQAVAEGLLSQDIMGIMFNSPTSANPNDLRVIGELKLGGISPELFCGNMTFIPKLTSSDIAGLLWSIDSSTLSLGGSSLLADASVTFDTGTSTLALPHEAFERYQNITGARLDPKDGLLHYNVSQAVNFPPLVIQRDGDVFTLPGAFQLIQGETPDDFIAIVSDLGELIDTADANLTIMGVPWFFGHYMAFDASKNEIGIATSTNSPGDCPP